MNIFIKYICFILVAFFTINCSDDSETVPEEPTKPIKPAPEESVDEEESEFDWKLQVVGRYLKDREGNVVNLHGFVQTYSPWFNEQGTKWTNYNVAACLSYNKGLIDKILNAGWKMDFVRLHMDPYWSNTPGVATTGESDISAFSMDRFEKYLDEVFVPMAEYAISKGMYVVMRPPGVCPKQIAVDDAYNKYLVSVWNVVSKHGKLKNNPNVMFELANEPVHILGTDGTYGADKQVHFDNLKVYFQQIVDVIRNNGADNILWVPGLGYQSQYAGFAVNPIEGDNIGYAVHLYPGWMGSEGENGDGGSATGGYASFQCGWNAQVQPVADFAPVMITEMDWAPEAYNSSWGKAITGVAGGGGFGANFKYITDNCGNVSWLLFTDPYLLAQFKDVAGTKGAYTFLNDPEACPWPIYHWYQDYADGGQQTPSALKRLVVGGMDGAVSVMVGSSVKFVVTAEYEDGTSEIVDAAYEVSDLSIAQMQSNGRMVALKEGSTTVKVVYDTKELTVDVTVTPVFPLKASFFNPSIWESGTFDEATATLVTGQYGFGGWKYPNGVDLSAFKYLVVELGNDDDSSVSFRLFDKNNYWSSPAAYDFGSSRKVTIELDKMYDADHVKVNPAHIYIAGFWSTGGKAIVIKGLTLTNVAE